MRKVENTLKVKVENKKTKNDEVQKKKRANVSNLMTDTDEPARWNSLACNSL